jgi:type II secretory pathway pseudopilin PulG
MVGNDTQRGPEPPAHWGTRAIALLLNPLVWLLVSIALVVAVVAVGRVLSSEHLSVPRWALTATVVSVLTLVLASPVAYVVLLRRCQVSWMSVSLRLAILISSGGLLLFCFVSATDLLGAIDRGKQKRTMHDMRMIASAIDAYVAGHPDGAHAASTEEVNAVLGSVFPRTDAWSNPFLVNWDGTHYLLRSLGRDGELDEGTTASTYQPGTTSSYDDDIVLEDGQFTRYPAGSQS